MRRERRVGLAMVLASLGFVISLSLVNVDDFIVKQNVQREIRATTDKAFAQGRADLDAQYFLDLSDDAIPPLVSAFHAKSLPASVKEKIGAALTCIRYNRIGRSYLPWQSFHLSRFSADRAFADVKKDLDAYDLIETDMKVKTPGGEEFSCWQYYYD